uniref:Uncharacterized protein n=1 Tax=Lygus hesperus TaxID=30085 RepID=A0A0A9ZHV0_LYGHE
MLKSTMECLRRSGASYVSRHCSKMPPTQSMKKKPALCLWKKSPCLAPVNACPQSNKSPGELKCPEKPICQVGRLIVPPLPKECKSDVKSVPVYDKTCVRTFQNICVPDTSKTCKCNMNPRPCECPCKMKKK